MQPQPTTYIYWRPELDPSVTSCWEAQCNNSVRRVPCAEYASTEQVIEAACECLPVFMLKGDIVVERDGEVEQQRDPDITEYLGGESMHCSDVPAAPLHHNAPKRSP